MRRREFVSGFGSAVLAYPLAARDYFYASRVRTLATTLAFNVLPFDRDVPACRAVKFRTDLLLRRHDVVALDGAQ